MCNEHQYASRTHCRKCGAAKGIFKIILKLIKLIQQKKIFSFVCVGNSKSVDEGQSNWSNFLQF